MVNRGQISQSLGTCHISEGIVCAVIGVHLVAFANRGESSPWSARVFALCLDDRPGHFGTLSPICAVCSIAG
jgi:hypothetical protein